jgi:predicted nucleic acid-binding protein
MTHIFLDSSPLGLLSKPTANAEVAAITQWAMNCLAAGHRIYIPEVIDYELRRELPRSGKTTSVAKLDSLAGLFWYLPVTTNAMRRAANLWAWARNTGIPTGDPKKLDIDVILAAQALTQADLLGVSGPDAVIATANVGHLSRFIAADLWTNITP